MKKDDKKPDEPKQKPQKKNKKPSESTPAHVFRDRRIEKKKHDLNLDAKKYRTGLSVGEWQELLKKDPALLTPRQAKQLEEANKMAIELAERITAQYDFSAIAKMAQGINTIPFAKIAQDANRFALATQKLQTNFILPAQQIVEFQKKLALTTGVINQSFIASINAANITRSFFADFQGIQNKIIKALSIDLSSLSNSLSRITPTEIIDVDVIDVVDRDGIVAVVSDAQQTKQIDDDFTYVSTAKLDLLLTEVQANRNEITELKQLFKGQLNSGITRITHADAKFDFNTAKMILKGIEVSVSRTSQQALFCDFFFSSLENFTKKWDIVDFVASAFNEHHGIDGNETSFNSKLKGIVKALNDKIALASKGQITQFFVLVNYTLYINPKYLSNL